MDRLTIPYKAAQAKLEKREKIADVAVPEFPPPDSNF
jgi:hypothetical protein